MGIAPLTHNVKTSWVCEAVGTIVEPVWGIVLAMVVSGRGTTAWIATEPPSFSLEPHPLNRRVFSRQRLGIARPLAEAPTIDPTSLRLGGESLTWTQDGVIQHVRLR